MADNILTLRVILTVTDSTLRRAQRILNSHPPRLRISRLYLCSSQTSNIELQSTERRAEKNEEAWRKNPENNFFLKLYPLMKKNNVTSSMLNLQHRIYNFSSVNLLTFQVGIYLIWVGIEQIVSPVITTNLFSVCRNLECTFNRYVIRGKWCTKMSNIKNWGHKLPRIIGFNYIFIKA